MAEEKKDNWTTFVALSTAFMAVLAALTTLYMGKFSSRTILFQAQESDQWNFYQAKSIKGHTYEMQKQMVELEYLTNKARMTPELAAKYKKVIEGYDASIKRYDEEKKDIKSKAEELDKAKDLSQTRAGKFSFGLIFLQIAIMVSSISVITKRKTLWVVGLVSAIIGVAYFVDGFYLIF